jgi:hypothetical protein
MILSQSKDLRSLLTALQKSRGLKTAMGDIRSFAKFCGCAEIAVPEVLFGHASTEEAANTLVLRYKEALEGSGKAPGTIRRRIGALRVLGETARELGFVTWTISVQPGPRFRDRRGLGASSERKVPALLMRDDPRGRRDLAILATIHEISASRLETTLLDLGDYDPNPGDPAIVTKRLGFSRERHGVSIQSKRILDAWVEIRGLKAGPLFTALDEKGLPSLERLSADDLVPIVRDAYDMDDLA